MHILYIIHDNRKGGAALSFIDTIKGVSKENEVYVLTPHKKGFIPDELDRLGIKHGSAHYFWWEIAKIGNPVIDTARFLMYRALDLVNHLEAHRLTGLVKKLGIDIIHSNSSVINIGALLSNLMGIPHVWHLRELALPEYPLYPAGKNDSISREFRTGNNSFVAISEYTAGFYKEHIVDHELINAIKLPETEPGDIQRNKRYIYTVYNGINSSYDHEKTRDDRIADIRRFLISGNYSEEKGQIDVAHAVGLLVSGGVTGFKVYMAGRGDFAEVRKYVDENGLSDYIEFCGLVDDMLSLRKKCDVEIVASRSEAFGRVTVEAMRASNPVIGSPNGGTTELIEDGVTGFLYEYKNDRSLAECMKRFIDKPSLAHEMGSKAYEWAVGRFTSEENIKGILKVYELILAQNNRCSS